MSEELTLINGSIFEDEFLDELEAIGNRLPLELCDEIIRAPLRQVQLPVLYK